MASNDDDTPRKERKEKVLHARIPESLDSELKERAEGLGVSVSNLVRNVLQNTFGMVEDIVADSQNIARNARGERTHRAPAPAPDREPTILGWQAITLNLNALCDQCNDILPKGSTGNIAVTDVPGKPVFRCDRCVKELAND